MAILLSPLRSLEFPASPSRGDIKSVSHHRSGLLSRIFFNDPILCSHLTGDRKSSVANLEAHLLCSMPHRRLKVAVLLSGGVDSSVSLRLLHAVGHSCTAFYIKIWFQEDFENFWAGCPWEEDLNYAKSVCDKIKVPLEIVNLTDEYWKNVASFVIEEYRQGRTPNPDIICNSRIKFGAFMDAISHMGFDYIASGHYAKIIRSSTEGACILELSKDMVKDQTYFLSDLSQTQLQSLIFPLGCISKDEVRKLAERFDLPNKSRKDSQGICFLGKIKFSEFILKHIGQVEGIIVEAETGDYLGTHPGFWFYTIGQRRGLRLSGGPWVVVEKNVDNNVVFVSRNYRSWDEKRTVMVGSLKWVSGSFPDLNGELLCKVRHDPGFYKCSITMEIDGPMSIGRVDISEVGPGGLAAGQYVVFYQGRTCLGSGVILHLGHHSVSRKAHQVAEMVDKSVLGKPVKILT